MCTPQELHRAADDALVGLLHDGCDAALEEIQHRFGGPLRAHARRLLAGSPHDPDDAVQDTMLRVWVSLRSDPRRPPLGPWLHTVVRNRSLDLLRSPVTRAAPLEAAAVVARPDLEEEVLWREALRTLADDLAGLPARQREALVRHAWGGESHEAIAGDLSTTAGSTKALVHRARRALRA